MLQCAATMLLHLHTLDVCEGAWVVDDARNGRSGLMRCIATLHGPSPSLLKDAGSEQIAAKPSRHLKLHDQDTSSQLRPIPIEADPT